MARKISNRKTKFKVAIVGEGLTEWYYFSNMKQHERFKFKLEPELPKHSDYKTLIRTARRKRDEGYDLIFCVLDMDRIITNETEKRGYYLEKTKIKSNRKIEFIESMPCIEFWFLQHFLKNYSSKVYLNYNQVSTALKQHIHNYDKTGNFLKPFGIYNHLNTVGNYSNANEFASKSIEEKNTSSNPLFNYTNMNALINKLKDIKR
ncbi:RloB family protein [Wenyingzhuangia sp. IMCC45467]